MSTNPSESLSAAHILIPRGAMEEAIWSEQSAPRPEHAKRAIWAGQAARSCEAASTDWGWASFASVSLSLSAACKIDLAKYAPSLEAMREVLDEKAAQERMRKALDNPALDAALVEYRGDAVTIPGVGVCEHPGDPMCGCLNR
ncbi:MAG: hypothetical protein ABI134_10885 [Byssovorax sp.]